MSLINEYKNKLIDYINADCRLSYKIASESEYGCMLHIFVLKNGNVEAIRLEKNEIAFWPINDEIIEKMTPEGFNNIIKALEYYMNNSVKISEYDDNNIELRAIEWLEKGELNEEQILTHWNQHNIECGTDAVNVHHLIFETFLGESKIRFEKTRGSWHGVKK